MFFKTITFFTFMIVFLGCSSKSITTQALYPSMENVKMKNIIIKEFHNDFINQSNKIKEKLANNFINNKRLFNLKSNYKDVDSIITGEVITVLNIDPYSKIKHNSFVCKEYIYDRKTKSKQCIKTIKKKIYCEKRNYNLKTNIEILDKVGNIKFNKIYEVNTNNNKCYENIPFNFHHKLKAINTNRNEDNIFMELAKDVANDFLADVSAYYYTYKIPLIEELEDTPFYSKEDKKLFKNTIDNIQKNKLVLLQEKLEDLNIKYQEKSEEILYTIAALYESKNLYYKAINYYNKALGTCKNKDNCDLIYEALNRVNKNIKLKNKALLQVNKN